MQLPPVDKDYLVEFLTGLLNNPSPTGFTEAGVSFTGEALLAFPELQIERTLKGELLAVWPGQQDDQPRALTAHVDTLGAMVKEIKANGRLAMTQVGGYPWNAVEGEGCTVYTAAGKQLRGSILINKASTHIYGIAKIEDTKRSQNNMEVRLDERTVNAAETRQLGIEIGDFIVIDPRVEVVNGFIRSRYLDDKAGVACMIAAVKALHDAGLRPLQKTCFHVSNYEEEGHGGASGIPDDVVELVVIDTGIVGEGQNSDEFHVSLCAKDRTGPYHLGLSRRLRQLAEANQIPYRVDVFTYYGSDGSAYWRAGGKAAVALVGPGVDASHHYERTHVDALAATAALLSAYILN